jgi:hypothetical protein
MPEEFLPEEFPRGCPSPGGDLANLTRCIMPTLKPIVTPSMVHSTPVPQRSSSQNPKTPGKDISKEMVVTRELHPMATANGERQSSCGSVTSELFG